MYANVIGAGIAGPMAAITLASQGYGVDVWETRSKRDLTSPGMLTISQKSWDLFKRHEITGAIERELYSPWPTTHKIAWTDLHLGLVERAEELGAQFHYGREFSPKESKVHTVVATGVGSAKEVSTPRYTGYVTARALSPRKAGIQWTHEYVDNFPEGPAQLVAGDLRNGTSLNFFLTRKEAPLHTVLSKVGPPELDGLDPEWDSITRSVGEWQFSAMSDWQVPSRMVYSRGATPIIRIGDANGQLRPFTGMGANLALAEAANRDLLVHQDSATERELLAEREYWYFAGLTKNL